MKQLKSLQDHNNSKSSTFVYQNGAVPNGIACPECGDELWDDNPNICLPSNPPQFRIHCRSCGYTGTRL
jgi:hypothetical protein